ncbi:M28 family peptidase [Oligoflexus tunisiensis]|uniref:M28 family peptidase n=1 Tax=Oligoflexus tunisiensis TaxID=708132 RepID=UPI00159F235C|nr:M28 family peptidase [Oligoflexus tunisiensis]
MRIVFSVWMGVATSLAQAGPVQVLDRGAVMEESGGSALLVTDRFFITRTPEARDEDFKDLYYLNLDDSRYDRFTLERFGRVTAFVPEALAVLEIPASNLEQAAAELHDERWACGQLIRLFGDEVPLHFTAKTATPVIAVTQKVKAIPSLHETVSPAAIQETVQAMVDLGTRYGRSSNAGAVTELLLKLYQDMAAGRNDITFEKVAHSGYSQPSLVVRIRGQRNPEDIIVLGSHIDSIARGSDLAPGADDNASGTASNLEVFRNIIAHDLYFDRTVEIHGYAVEELGLIGSQEIARRYVNGGKNVIAMMQNDMNMFKGAKEDMIWLITNDSDPQLTASMETLLAQYQTVKVDKNRLLAGTSDHRSWNRLGVPVVFPTENPTNYNRKIHTPNDVIASSGAFTQSAEFVKLSLSFLAHYAGLVTAP